MNISFPRIVAAALLAAVGLMALGNAGCNSSDSDNENTPNPETNRSEPARKNNSSKVPATVPATVPEAKDLSKPKAFFANMYKAAKSGDAKVWANVLTKARRERGEAYVKKHFDKWAGEIVGVVEEGAGGKMDAVKVSFRGQDTTRLTVQVGERKLPPLQVALENGALRLDEN